MRANVDRDDIFSRLVQHTQSIAHAEAPLATRLSVSVLGVRLPLTTTVAEPPPPPKSEAVMVCDWTLRATRSCMTQ
jgi:hypothetical protein